MPQQLLHAAICAGLSLSAGATVAAPAFIDFDTNGIVSGIGAVTGGADPRAPGVVNQFYLPDNAATSGSVAIGVGRGGSNGLVVGNRGNGFDGVIDNLKTGRLAQGAGESTVASFNSFVSSYWFRTSATSAPTGNFRFRSESWGTDRNTFLGFQNSGTDLVAIARGVSPTGEVGGFPSYTVATGLAWGAWYQVVTQAIFWDGANNDVVNFSIFNDLGALVGQVSGAASWEQGQRLSGYNGGNLIAADAVQFHARGSATGTVAFVDDVRWEARNAVPVPGTLALTALGLMGAGVVARRRRA